MTRRPPAIALTVLFLALGLLVFLIDGWFGTEPAQRIVVDEPTVQRLVDLWQAQAQRPPTVGELEALVAGHVREEVLVREARELGLDQDDVILRRRLAQKMSFLLEDLSQPDLPTDGELQSYFDDNRPEFLRPATQSFQHIYLGDRAAAGEQDVEAIRAALAAGAAWRSLGRPFMLQREYAQRSAAQIDDLFGNGFAELLTGVPLDIWHGPVSSGLGVHLVRVLQRTPEHQPDLDEVRDRVLERLFEERRRSNNEQAYLEIAGRYRIELPDRGLLEAKAVPTP